MKQFLNCKPFVMTVRAVGWLYIIAILINTVFFYNRYLYQTFLSCGLFGVLAIHMTTYKKETAEWKTKPLKRVLYIVFDVLLLIFVCWRVSVQS